VSSLTPVDDAERIRGLDRLRGVALLGILLANVRQLLLPWDIADLPLAHGIAPAVAWADWAVFDALVDMKFLTLFSLLFGIGFALQGERIARRGERFRGIYLRRVLLLALFGLAHGLLLYPAEVLLGYAVAGSLLLSARRLSADAMIRLGLGLLGIATIWSYQITCLGRVSLPIDAVAVAAIAACLVVLPSRSWRLTLVVWTVVVLGAAGALTLRPERGSSAAADFAEARRGFAAMETGDAKAWPEEYRVRREGDLGGLLALHARQYAAVLSYFAILLLWRTLGLFLVGAGLHRLGVVGEGSPVLWRRVAGWGVGVGLPLSVLATALHSFEIRGIIDWRLPELLHEISALPLAAGIAGALFLVDPGKTARGLWVSIEAAGRMALTNYLGQSLLLAALAERWGLGLYGKYGAPILTLLALVVFAVLALLSRAWLARFRLGPLEWLWRCGTYRRWLPNRSASGSFRTESSGLSSV
jgi:uncharacterized protein